MLENANLLDKILSEKELSHTNLCLLIEKIIIHEDEYGLRLEMHHSLKRNWYDMRGRLRGSVCLTNNRHEKSLQSNPVSFLSVVRMKGLEPPR